MTIRTNYRVSKGDFENKGVNDYEVSQQEKM
jgi:hypothetical protein